MLTSRARLCRPCRLAGPAHAAATAGFSIQEREILRETDCLLEGDGFEPSVPRHNKLCVAPATNPPVAMILCVGNSDQAVKQSWISRQRYAE